MAEFKLVIGDPKTGKCYQRVVKDAEAKIFLGKKIGEKVEGKGFGLEGYEFEITGGSDHCGFPMRRDVPGPSRKRILAGRSTGVRKVKKGERVRKTVAGNTIHAKISQINLKIVKYGKAKLEETKEENKGEEQKEKNEGKTQ